jgi:hypothetical protein
MSTPPFVTPPHQNTLPAGTKQTTPEPVWGAPSAEMLQSEQDGDIVLIEDMTRTFPSREKTESS